MGPKPPRSTVLDAEDEAVVVALRHYTPLPLDDWLYALQPTLPHLARSSLHRCLAAACRLYRHPSGGSLPVQELPDRLLSPRHRRGHTEQGHLYLFVTISCRQAADPNSRGDRASSASAAMLSPMSAVVRIALRIRSAP